MRPTPAQAIRRLKCMYRGAVVAADECQRAAFEAPEGSEREKDTTKLATFMVHFAEAMQIVLNPYPRRRS